MRLSINPKASRVRTWHDQCNFGTVSRRGRDLDVGADLLRALAHRFQSPVRILSKGALEIETTAIVAHGNMNHILLEIIDQHRNAAGAAVAHRVPQGFL